jgi:soluble lytic murein transglycosylase-like protein
MRNVVRILFASALFIATAGALSGQASAGNPQAFAALIATHAAANGIPVELAHAVVRHESNFNPRVTGRAGEIGLMQIKLQTARGMGYRGTRQGLYDPATNIKWGMIYLGQARRLAGGSECGTLSRYNGGLATKRIIKSYCRGVMARVPASSRAMIAKAPVKPALDRVRVAAASATGKEPSLFKSLFASAN